MTDTETRLRDYLNARAATVPDHAEPPGLDESATPKRHLWPVLMAAAAIGAVLVITVPLLNRLADGESPATPPAPGIAVPYYERIPGEDMMPENWETTLHDGKTTVKLPKGIDRLKGRVAGGWAGTTARQRPGGGTSVRIGVLETTGTFRAFGPQAAGYLEVSPDRKQLATTEALGGGKSRISVYDAASGRQVASLTSPHRTSILYGWNKDGIWFAEDYKVNAQPSVWQPSTGKLTQLAVTDFSLRLVVPSGSERFLFVTRPPTRDSWCVKAARLVAGKPAVDREYCGTGGKYVYPTLSIDGNTILLFEQNLAIDVATGRQTRLRLPSRVDPTDRLAFEDGKHFLVVFGGGRVLLDEQGRTIAPRPSSSTNSPTRVGGIVEGSGGLVYRCDLSSGSCEQAMTVPDDAQLSLIQP